MKREPSPFDSEAELCAAFITWAKGFGLQAYPETCGWDILLVAADGTQLGVQAKMVFNMKLLHQTVEPDGYFGDIAGPDFRAILLPRRSGHDSLVYALGFGEFYPARGRRVTGFEPKLGPVDRWLPAMHFWNPTKRCTLPNYVPDVVAGAPSPIQLTDWKERALRLTAILELRGYLTTQDFKIHRVDKRIWAGPKGWLIPIRAGVWRRGPELRFDTQHPEVYAAIKAEEAEKLRDEPEPKQLDLANE